MGLKSSAAAAAAPAAAAPTDARSQSAHAKSCTRFLPRPALGAF